MVSPTAFPPPVFPPLPYEPLQLEEGDFSGLPPELPPLTHTKMVVDLKKSPILPTSYYFGVLLNVGLVIASFVIFHTPDVPAWTFHITVGLSVTLGLNVIFGIYWAWDRHCHKKAFMQQFVPDAEPAQGTVPPSVLTSPPARQMTTLD